MKKNTRLFALLLAVVMITALVGCGASNGSGSIPAAGVSHNSTAYDSAPSIGYNSSAMQAAPAGSEEMGYDEYATEILIAKEPLTQVAAVDPDTGEVTPVENFAEKIIYNADMTLETTEFDDALERIAALVQELGGYMESTSISGSNYNSIARGNAGTRNAYYEIRIPSANFTRFNNDLSALGNVPYNRTYTRNITSQYYDIKSRLDAFKVQETRLLEMLAIAETVDDMLSIQQQLTEVQYEIDSLTGTLRYYDNQVSYSTVYLSVEEVREYTPTPTVTLTYWERMQKEFGESMRNTGRFFTEFFLWFVTSLPWLIPLALAVALVVWLLRRRARNRPQRLTRRQARKEAKARAKAGMIDVSPFPTETNSDNKK